MSPRGVIVINYIFIGPCARAPDSACGEGLVRGGAGAGKLKIEGGFLGILTIYTFPTMQESSFLCIYSGIVHNHQLIIVNSWTYSPNLRYSDYIQLLPANLRKSSTPSSLKAFHIMFTKTWSHGHFI